MIDEIGWKMARQRREFLTFDLTVWFIVLLYALPSICQLTCPDGWILYVKGQSCFWFPPYKSDEWHHARSFCQDRGADLPVLSDSDTNEFFKTIAPEIPASFFLPKRPATYWTGVNDIGQEGRYRWLDDSKEITFSKWARREPNKRYGFDCGVTEDSYWMVINCLFHESVACQKSAIAGSTMPRKCPSNWYFYSPRGTCFNFEDNTEANWYDSRVYCKLFGGDLIAIGDSQTLQFLLGIAHIDVWTGLHEREQKGQFFLLDETTEATFFRWDKDQPSTDKNKRCVVAVDNRLDEKEFASRNCLSRQPFSCEIPSLINGTTLNTTLTAEVTTHNTNEPCPPAWKYYPQGKICYHRYRIKLTWNDGRRACNLYGGRLAAVTDASRNTIINYLVGPKKKSFWIGLKYNNDSGFLWNNDKEVKYLNWASRQPSKFVNDTNSCGYFLRSKWYDDVCSVKRQVICERDAVQVPSIPTPVTDEERTLVVP